MPDIRRDPGVLSAGDIRVPGQLDGFQAAGGDVFVVGYFFDGALVGHFGEASEDCVGLGGVGLLRWRWGWGMVGRDFWEGKGFFGWFFVGGLCIC